MWRKSIMEIQCENKCGNLTVEGRNICYDCIVSERDRIIDHGDQG